MVSVRLPSVGVAGVTTNPELAMMDVSSDVALTPICAGLKPGSATEKLTASGVFMLSNCLPMGEMDGAAGVSRASSSSNRRMARRAGRLFLTLPRWKKRRKE